MSDEVVVKIPASLDAETAEKLLAELTRVVSGAPSRLVCDLSGTDYISSISGNGFSVAILFLQTVKYLCLRYLLL